jgi:hypothetical protein
MLLLRVLIKCQAWWLTPVIPLTWEVVVQEASLLKDSEIDLKEEAWCGVAHL